MAGQADQGPGALPALHLFSASGRVPEAAALRRAAQRLTALGFVVTVDDAALAREQRFAGDDATRLAAIHRVAAAAPSIAMATRGGYGLTRLLDGIAWKRLARAVDRGTRWVGHSDLTALLLGLYAQTGRASWAGPMATDFSRSEQAGGVDEVTRDCFSEAMSGALEAVGFRTAAGQPDLDGLERRGVLWGGNLAMVVSLLGTPFMPRPEQVKGGLLFLEDVGEHPYRIERMLLQLLQAGVITSQRAVLLGSFNDYERADNDRGYTLKTAIARLRSATRVPVLTGLPFGHVRTKVTLPVGRQARLLVDGRDVLVGWSD